jgi:hypothetical protein
VVNREQSSLHDCRPVRGTVLQVDDADIRQAIRAVLSAVQLNTGF